MPVNIELKSENRIAIVKWSDSVTNDDFIKVFSFMEPVYQTAQQPVHSIYLATGLTTLPPRTISTFLNDPRSPLVHRMSGLTVIVTSSFFIKAVADATAKLSYTDRVRLVRTFEDALAKVETALAEERAA